MPDQGLWESLEGSSLVLVKLRRDGTSVLYCSLGTAQAQVHLGALLSLVQRLMHSKGCGFFFLTMDFTVFEKVHLNTIWLYLKISILIRFGT